QHVTSGRLLSKQMKERSSSRLSELGRHRGGFMFWMKPLNRDIPRPHSPL
ncbi:hypothetical protein BgiMline_011954, partial [Biomphalaria glabrata]